jgi:hypothetical protein
MGRSSDGTGGGRNNSGSLDTGSVGVDNELSRVVGSVGVLGPDLDGVVDVSLKLGRGDPDESTVVRKVLCARISECFYRVYTESDARTGNDLKGVEGLDVLSLAENQGNLVSSGGEPLNGEGLSGSELNLGERCGDGIGLVSGGLGGENGGNNGGHKGGTGGENVGETHF